MPKKGIHVAITEEWSPPEKEGRTEIRYRIWNKRGKVYCLRQKRNAGEEYEVDVSSTLENVDMDVGEIFDIPDFPFDSQHVIRYHDGELKVEEPGKKDYAGKAARRQVAEIFNTDNVDAVLKELTGQR